jgi:hypothetical protein
MNSSSARGVSDHCSRHGRRLMEPPEDGAHCDADPELVPDVDREAPGSPFKVYGGEMDGNAEAEPHEQSEHDPVASISDAGTGQQSPQHEG